MIEILDRRFSWAAILALASGAVVMVPSLVAMLTALFAVATAIL